MTTVLPPVSSPIAHQSDVCGVSNVNDILVEVGIVEVQASIPHQDRRSWAAAVVKTARPRQWIKNVLVFSVPAAAGSLFIPAIGLSAAAAALAFSLAASATYFFNDAQDVQADRQHPVKRYRPVATGELSTLHARLLGGLSAVAGLGIAGLISLTFLGVVAGYLLLTTTYSMKLKTIPVLEVLVVAAGFVIRAAGGAAATGLAMSTWFLLVAMFGSLYLVLGKRSAELTSIPEGQTMHRAALGEYSSSWINQTLVMALTSTVVSYALWAVQYVGHDFSAPLLAVSLLPFLAGIMRYSLLVSLGRGERPEVVLTTDRFLIISGTIWVCALGAGLYLA